MISEEKRAEIIALRAAGTGVKAVAKRLNVAVQSVYNVEKQYKLEHPEEFETLKKEFVQKFADKAQDIILTALGKLQGTLNDPDANISAKDLSTIIGTMYDKRALAVGDTTENTKIEFKLPKELNDYAE